MKIDPMPIVDAILPSPAGYVRAADFAAMKTRAETAETHRDELDALLNEGIASDEDTRQQARAAALRQAAAVARERWREWPDEETHGAPKVSCDVTACQNIANAILALIDIAEDGPK